MWFKNDHLETAKQEEDSVLKQVIPVDKQLAFSIIQKLRRDAIICHKVCLATSGYV